MRHYSIVVAAALILGCAAKKGYDPCSAWKAEQTEIMRIENRLQKTEKRIHRYREKNDTAVLNSALRERDALLESRRNAQIAAENGSYGCQPDYYPNGTPLNPNQDLEERRRNPRTGW